MSSKVTKGWTIAEAQALVGAMASKADRFGYTPTIGGSVLTSGKSAKNLNLFFIPNGFSWMQQTPVDLLMWLAAKFGTGKTLGDRQQTTNNGAVPRAAGPAGVTSKFVHRMEFNLDGRSIHVYVL